MTESSITLLRLSLSTKTYAMDVELHLAFIVFAILVILSGLWVFSKRPIGWLFKEYEIDQAEIGVGSGKVRIKPNYTDRQIAYAIWVELSTRKIGMEIDFENDVLYEVYDSWYKFFGITRDLIKAIPISRAKEASTLKIVNMSIEVLNHGIRPHLTRWQARFRHWYKLELEKKSDGQVISPQELQAGFPEFRLLKDDLMTVNKRLIAYRETMKKLAFGH